MKSLAFQSLQVSQARDNPQLSLPVKFLSLLIKVSGYGSFGVITRQGDYPALSCHAALSGG